MSSEQGRPSLEQIRQSLEKKRPTATQDVAAMRGSGTAEQRKQYAESWVKQPGLNEVLEGMGVELPWGVVLGTETKKAIRRSLRSKELVDKKFAEQMQPFFKGHPAAPKYYSLGAGLHGGYGAGTAGFEGGSIWSANSFGQVPMRDPVADYTVEWVTFGIPTGFDIGVSVDLMAFTTWFVDIDQIAGACNAVTLTGAYFGGLTISLYWTGTWQGAQGTPNPIGVGVVSSAGIEFGAGVFYNASATQFFNKRSN